MIRAKSIKNTRKTMITVFLRYKLNKHSYIEKLIYHFLIKKVKNIDESFNKVYLTKNLHTDMHTMITSDFKSTEVLLII